MFRKNSISKLFVAAVLVSASVFPVTVYGVDSNVERIVSYEHANCKLRVNKYSITPHAEIRSYSYTQINGYCFRRLWLSNTFCYWVDKEWSVCPTYLHRH